MGKTLAVCLAFCLAFAPLSECAASEGAAARSAALPQYDSSYQEYSPEQLDNLLAPIALYPDPLLAQVLLAATFVDQIDDAQRYVRAYGQAGVDDQPWDVSVKAVAHYPTVLTMMADKLDWTTALGQAYVYQSTDVMTAVQRLRGMAYAQGNLVTTPEQEVDYRDGIYAIYPAQPQYIFVPVYQPSVIYFRRAYYPGGWLGGVFAFGAGFLIGAWLNHDCDWRGRRVYYTGWEGRGWVERSRPYVRVTNVYVNNRYTNVTINRTVVNRPVNYDNMNRYHAVHRDVTYDNHARDNQRRDTQGRDNQGRPPAVANAPGRVNNSVINRNIDTNDPRLDKYRGRTGGGPPAERPEQPTPRPEGRPTQPPESRPQPQPPAARPQPQPPAVRAQPPEARPQPQPPAGRPQPQPPAARPQPQPQPPPHAFGRNESGIDPRVSSPRGQSSRGEMSRPPAQSPRPAPSAPRSAPSSPRPTPAPRPAPSRPPGGRP